MKVHVFDDEPTAGHHGPFIGGIGNVLLADGHEVAISSPDVPPGLDPARLRWHRVAPATPGDRALSLRNLRAAGRRCGPDGVFLDLYLDKSIPFIAYSTRHVRRSVHVLHRPFRYVGKGRTALGVVGRAHVRREFRRLARRGSWVVVHSSSGLRAVDELGSDRAARLGFPVVHQADLDQDGLVDARAPAPGRLLFVGTARPEKGLPVLLAALEALGEGYELQVLGPQAAGLADHVAANYPRARVIWADRFVSGDELRVAYQRASLVVLPYARPHTYLGGASGVALDAMRHGIPMVVTDVVAAELPPDYRGMVVAERGSASDLRRAIDWAGTNSESLRQHAWIDGRAHILQNHTFEAYTRAMVELCR